MQLQPTLHMMCGLPGSGKSTYAKRLAEEGGILYFSSDELRVELFGNIAHQEDNAVIFQELRNRASHALSQGQSVVMDATNAAKKKRMQEIKSFYEPYHKVIHYCGTHIAWTKEANRERERQVPSVVINNMYRAMEVPFYDEGWDEIHLVFPYERELQHRQDLIERVLNAPSFPDFNQHVVEIMSDYRRLIALSHDQPNQPLTVDEHTYRVFDYIRQYYHEEGRELLLWTAIFHDLGKAYTKSFKTKKGKPSLTAYFYRHEYISAQLACHYLYQYGYDEEMILQVAYLIQLHMKIATVPEKGVAKWIERLGEEMYGRLKFFQQANTQAR